jgi:hypothetical protein
MIALESLTKINMQANVLKFKELLFFRASSGSKTQAWGDRHDVAWLRSLV